MAKLLPQRIFIEYYHMMSIHGSSEYVVVNKIQRSSWTLSYGVLNYPITTKVLSSNLTHGEGYSIQHYVISLSVTCTGWRFSLGIPVSSTNKTGRHNFTEIVLNVALNTIPLAPNYKQSLTKWILKKMFG